MPGSYWFPAAPSFPLSDLKNGFGPRGLWQQEATCCVISDRRRSDKRLLCGFRLTTSQQSSLGLHAPHKEMDQSLKVRDGRSVRSGKVVGQLLPSLCPRSCFISTKSLAHFSSTADVQCARTGERLRLGSTRVWDGEESPLKSQLMEPMRCGEFHQHRCDYKTRFCF